MEEKKIRNNDSNRITRAYLDSLLVEQRLIDSDLPDLTTTIFGKKYSTPIMSAAFSHLHSYGSNAAVEMAKGIKEAGALNWWGLSNDAEMESIFATGCDTVKIIKRSIGSICQQAFIEISERWSGAGRDGKNN